MGVDTACAAVEAAADVPEAKVAVERTERILYAVFGHFLRDIGDELVNDDDVFYRLFRVCRGLVAEIDAVAVGAATAVEVGVHDFVAIAYQPVLCVHSRARIVYRVVAREQYVTDVGRLLWGFRSRTQLSGYKRSHHCCRASRAYELFDFHRCSSCCLICTVNPTPIFRRIVTL